MLGLRGQGSPDARRGEGDRREQEEQSKGVPSLPCKLQREVYQLVGGENTCVSLVQKASPLGQAFR